MSYADKFRKPGGKILDNVDGTITSVTFLAAMMDGSKPKKGVPCPLWAVVNIDQDGKSDPQLQYLKVCGTGGDTEWKISKDGKTATPLSETIGIWRTEDGLQPFLTSLVDEAGFDEARLPEPVGAPLNFACLVGERFRFVQKLRTDEWALDPKNYRVAKKTGKTYQRTFLAVSEFYTTVSSRLQHGKPNGRVTIGEETPELADIAPKALKTLKAVLKKADSPILYTELKLKVQTALMGDSDRNAVWAYLSDPGRVASLPGVLFDPAATPATVSLDIHF